jgi:hypothetical protein
LLSTKFAPRSTALSTLVEPLVTAKIRVCLFERLFRVWASNSVPPATSSQSIRTPSRCRRETNSTALAESCRKSSRAPFISKIGLMRVKTAGSQVTTKQSNGMSRS